MMLGALDLARRIEAGELTPRAVVELCAEAIAASEAKVGAFVTLDLDGARRAARSHVVESRGSSAAGVVAAGAPHRASPQ